MHIQNFNSGDIVVRTAAGKKEQEMYNENLGVSTIMTMYEDTSYIGQPFKLLDVCNGMIYLEVIGQMVCGFEGKRQMPFQIFKEGWEFFTVPNGYTMEEIRNI